MLSPVVGARLRIDTELSLSLQSEPPDGPFTVAHGAARAVPVKIRKKDNKRIAEVRLIRILRTSPLLFKCALAVPDKHEQILNASPRITSAMQPLLNFFECPPPELPLSRSSPTVKRQLCNREPVFGVMELSARPLERDCCGARALLRELAQVEELPNSQKEALILCEEARNSARA